MTDTTTPTTAADDPAVDFDEERLEAFMGSLIADMGGATTMAMVCVGDELGLYQAMDGKGPVTPAELSAEVGCNARLVQEWLDQQAAAGYVVYDPGDASYALPAEQAMALRQAFRDVEYQWVGPDGVARWMRTSGVPFFNEDGEILGYRGAAFCIDYEKSLEAERTALMDEVAAAKQRLEGAIAAQSSGFDSAAIEQRWEALSPSEQTMVDRMAASFYESELRLAQSRQIEASTSSIYTAMSEDERAEFRDARRGEWRSMRPEERAALRNVKLPAYSNLTDAQKAPFRRIAINRLAPEPSQEDPEQLSADPGGFI